ncbi:BC1872 family protein [Bacillus benzoevorans]|uniref:Phage ABA sandwich domain-containing protein n=1 Tax=Bacillus benzoevorans TaxID=1456 RepID=A0A7X0LVF6_9BACI|nr:hypothetical protein [Bacillus benzoevorans]MBB6444239.1 hypothetical protein [Bacillus benzoevorans]
MNKTEVIARRILGWKLNRWDRWYDFETGEFIYDCDFQPEQNLDHAMRIVDRLEEFGFTYEAKSQSEVYFNNVAGTGRNLAEAITNAAYSVADNSTVPEEWMHYQII